MFLYKKAIETNVKKAEQIIKCICLLHNIIIDREDEYNDKKKTNCFSQNSLLLLLYCI